MPTHRRGSPAGNVWSISVLAVALVVAFGTVTVVSLYLSRVSSTLETMARGEPVPGYDGRPQKASADTEAANPALDVLVLVTDEHDQLLSAHIAHLSASRRELTIVGLPSDLLVPYGPGQPQRTLAEYYADGSGELVQQVELLLGIPTDHQVRIGLDGFSGVVDALGGLDGHAADGRELLRYIAEAEDGPTRVERVSEIVRATLQQLGMLHAVTNPGQFDRVLQALEECVLVDSDLTAAEFEGTLMESSVRADEIGSVTLETIVSDTGRRALPNHLAKLRKALRNDTVAALGEPLPSSPPR
ncbi:MAG: LCP family protein [Propionicimonas sp.]